MFAAELDSVYGLPSPPPLNPQSSSCPPRKSPILLPKTKENHQLAPHRPATPATTAAATTAPTAPRGPPRAATESTGGAAVGAGPTEPEADDGSAGDATAGVASTCPSGACETGGWLAAAVVVVGVPPPVQGAVWPWIWPGGQEVLVTEMG